MARGAQSTLTNEQLTEEIIGIVREAAQAALNGEPVTGGLRNDGYLEAYGIASTLIDRGVLDHELLHASAANRREDGRKSTEGKVKRLLDTEAAKPDARILRFSSRNDDPPFRLDGYTRNYYGQSVLYGTPELVEKGQQAFQARLERERAQEQTMAALLDAAREAGLPEPTAANARSVTYDADGLAAILKLIAA